MCLRNMGFLPGDEADQGDAAEPGDDADQDDERIAAALAAFQAVHGAGSGDPWEHVAEVHGC